MHWTDTSIILSARKHGENSAVARIFARQHGVYSGVIKGIHSKSMRGVIQPGNIVTATWNARLPEHLGTFRTELLEAHAAHIMHDSGRLSALASACAIIESALPERHPYPRLHKAFQSFLATLRDSDHWQETYIWLEMEILAETGFGLDLSACAATGRSDGLTYVSPKSGRAVSFEAGKPYHDKLLPLPPFLLGNHQKNRLETAEILDGLQLTGYFLDHWLLAPHHRKLPAARNRMQLVIEKKELTEAT